MFMFMFMFMFISVFMFMSMFIFTFIFTFGFRSIFISTFRFTFIVITSNVVQLSLRIRSHLMKDLNAKINGERECEETIGETED
jgi:hypothetical protein